jgi:hypothetical protein
MPRTPFAAPHSTGFRPLPPDHHRAAGARPRLCDHRAATRLAIDYAFSVLNLRKIYLIVDKSNAAAIHVYGKCGFTREAELIEEFFGNGAYHNALRMCMFQRDFFAARVQPNGAAANAKHGD